MMLFVNVDDSGFIGIGKEKGSVGEKVYGMGSGGGVENRF